MRATVVEICDQIIEKAPPEPPEDWIEQKEAEDLVPHATIDHLFSAVWNCSICASGPCAGASAPNKNRHHSKSQQSMYHPARLYLGKPQNSGDAIPLLDLLVSSHRYDYWQEIGLVAVPHESEPNNTALADRRKGRSTKRVRFAENTIPPSDPKPSRLARAEVSGFCSVLARKTCARMFLELEDQRLVESEVVETLQHNLAKGEGVPLAQILRDYNITISARISLAFSIARTFWQLYDTKLTSTRWTDRNIWFSCNDRDSLSCKAYIALPFQQEGAQLDEYRAGLIHRCPRIFALGVLLLEIGLARPIESQHPEPSDPLFLGRTNEDHATATALLRELKKEPWNGYYGKRFLDRAIDDCLDGKNFSPRACGSEGCGDALERRKALYEKVVEPLGLLASSFPPVAHGSITKIIKAQAEDESKDRLVLPRLEVSEFSPSILSHGSFHAGRSISPEEWLEDLRRIGRYVHETSERINKAEKRLAPIRVAILDSGCNLQAEYFEEAPQRVSRITAWKDFVDRSFSGSNENCPHYCPEEKQDTFGHGTFMAMLLMDTAPAAELIIGRVAENTSRLDGRAQAISKVISSAFLSQA